MKVQLLGATAFVRGALGRLCFRFFLAGLCVVTHAEGEPESNTDTECTLAKVLAHVQEQFRLYGPLSLNREYFGFIYRFNEVIQSSVVRGRPCASNDVCTVDNAPAAKGIPPGAKVLGEWHTHPRIDGSVLLSMADVLGAHRNRHIRCYTAYYSEPSGEIHSWDIESDSVPVAMASRTLLGNFRDPEGVPAIIAAH